MHYIAHRRNTLEQLQETDTKYGVEVDIRTWGDELVVHHDAFVHGNSFEEWVANYKHGTLILNVKEEGLEQAVLDLMAKYNIEDYFFLDQSFPFLVKWSKLGLNRAAVRVSEFESVDTALTLSGKVDWVWADCFTHFSLSAGDYARLKGAGFKICLVSPELQQRDPEVEIKETVELMADRDIIADAICTKRPDIWEQCLG